MDKLNQLNSDIEKRNTGYELIRGTIACNGGEKNLKLYTPASGIWLIVINGQILADTNTRAYIVCYVNNDDQNVLMADILPTQYYGNGAANIYEFNGNQPVRFAAFSASGASIRYNIGLICLKKA